MKAQYIIRKIAIIGPECTGKTTLTEALAEHFNTLWIPEFAREYVQNLNSKYSFQDVEMIAKKQIEELNRIYPTARHFVFYDTDLIITKVWFEHVFNKLPTFVDPIIASKKIDFYLLCDTDIDWQEDGVRENGGDMRELLFKKYMQVLDTFNLPYEIISGTDESRLNNAIKAIGEHFLK